jgi:hypothetical protein
MGFPFLYLVPFTDKVVKREVTLPRLDQRALLRSMKHSHNIAVCQVAITSTVKEVSRDDRLRA